jgi:hypothetical protein
MTLTNKPTPGGDLDEWGPELNECLDELDANADSRIPAAALAAKGQLLTATAPGAVSALPLGTNGQVLTADTAQPRGMAWKTPPTPAAALVTAKGDLLTGTAPGTLDRVGVGANGQHLTADSAQTGGVTWADPPPAGIAASTLQGKGDLISATGAATPARLPAGTTGQILSSDPAQATGLRWADPAPGSLIYCTSTTRPAPVAGSTIFETDTNRRLHGISVGGTGYWVPLPGAVVLRVRQTTVQSIPDATATPINFQAVDKDPYALWATGQPTRFTPTFPGWFDMAGGTVFTNNATGIRYVYWKKKAADVPGSVNAYTGAAASLQGGAPRTCAVYLDGLTDYMELIGYQNSGVALTTFITNVQYQATMQATYLGA